MAYKHMKMCLSVVIRQMQIKITVRMPPFAHLAVLNQTVTCYWKKLKLLYCAGENESG